jgi:hypothetical protein
MRRSISAVLLLGAGLVLAAACDGGTGLADDTGDTPTDAETDAPPDTAPPECTFAPDPWVDPGPPDPPATTDYLILAADPVLAAAQDLADYRRTRGHTVEVLPVSTALDDGTGHPDVAGAVPRIRALVAARRTALDAARPFFLLLFGDGVAAWDGDPAYVPAGTWLDPAHWVDEITSDNLFVDLDGDELPDAAVGRVPLSDPGDAARYVAAVQAYEATYEPGPWNRTIHVFASEGGFGELLDDIMLDVGMRVIGEVPPEWTVTFTYAAQNSVYTYPPDLFSDRIYAYLNQGGFLMSYVGHGSPSGFTDASWEGGPSGPIFDAGDIGSISIAHRAPLLVFIACSTGSFDTGDSITERLLRQPGSSPVVMSSTEMSHPYSNTIFVREVGRVGLTERPRTVGELFQRAKQAMIEQDDELRVFLDNMAAIQLTPEEMANLPAAHLHMYTLFGDPGLELAYPRGSVDVAVESARLPPGGVVRFCAQVHGPPAGTAHVTFEIVRTELARDTALWTLADESWRDVVSANHESANDKVMWSTDVPYVGGGFGLSFVVPPETHHLDHHVVVYAADDAQDAMGSALVRIRVE